MKITNVKIRELATEIPGFSGSTYKVATRRTLLCRIETDEGAVSEVCVGNERTYSDALKTAIRGPLRELIVGRDPRCTTELWRLMFSKAIGNVDRATIVRAIAVLDICLWDLKGQISGLPLWQLIGGARSQVPMIAIGGYYETSGDEKGIRAEIQSLKKRNLAGIKFKVGGRSMDEDLRRVAIAREEGGEDFVIVADSNKGWSTEEACRFAEELLKYRPEWLEEPVYFHNMEKGLREVRTRTGIRTAAGQSEVSAFDCYSFIAREAVDVVNVTANRGGGITPWLMVAGTAATAGIRMAQVAEPHIGVHLMCGILNATFAECYSDERRDPFWGALYRDVPSAKNGLVEAPTSPGVGLTLDPKAVERFAVESYA